MEIPDKTHRRAQRLERGPQTAGGGRRVLARKAAMLLKREEQGQAILELALTLPLLMTILLGMFSLTVALYNYEQLAYSTFNAAQQVGAGRGLLTDPCATVAAEVPAGLPNFTASNLTYSLTITDSSGTQHKYGPSGSSFTCTAGATQMGQNEPLTVAVSYKYSWIPAYLVNLSGNLYTTETVLID